MGVVYKARQPRLNRFVALKILAREKEKDPRFAERFTREAQALARLNHPNIVTVYDFGETNGLYYLLMEFVDGMSLRQLLQTRKLAPEEALAIVPSICEALQYAHQLGIVHRDIKPENILLDQQGRVKIADYGIAKLVGADGRVDALTGEQQVIGTPHYMAPEQVEKPSIVDHRADIFSLGVVFYEMLTGELPMGKFAPPSRMVKMDVRLDEVVLHALEKEPELRYQQASQVKTDVETIARTEAGSTQSEPGRSQPAPGVAAASAIENVWRQVKGPGTGLVVTAILNWVTIPLVSLVALLLVLRTEGHHAYLVLVPLAALVLSSVMLAAGLMMKRLGAYSLAIVGAILAILITPGNLIGLPIGIWALVVLSRREVREAFGKGLPMPGLALGQANRGSGAWKVVVPAVATVLILLAIPLGAVFLAIAVPEFVKARNRAREVQEAMRYQPPLPPAYRQGAEQAASGPELQALDETVKRGSEASASGDYSKALRILLPAAQQGHPIAQHLIGVMYIHGLGVEQDFAEATRWFRKAAEQGQGEAQFSMGLRYLLGQSVAQDDKEAARWFRQAADQGVGMAASVLAELCAKGRGVPRDLVEAYKWLSVAGDQIEPTQVSVTLSDLESKLTPDQLAEARRRAKEFVPKPTPQAAEVGEPAATSPEDEILRRLNVRRGSEAWASGDFAQALKLLMPAAEQGNPVAQHRIGVMYVMGQEVPQDNGQATYWFRKAADQGQGESQYSMGLRYLWGQSVAQDYKAAVRWFTLAADQGVVLAAAALKNRYAEGEGVPRDLVEAYKWGLIAGGQADPSSPDHSLSELEDKLTPEQLAYAQRRAKAFVPKRTGPADP
jgi:TPR repeat protein/tRNA A-37 threonylcarbamoyl transferase component Bud32